MPTLPATPVDNGPSASEEKTLPSGESQKEPHTNVDTGRSMKEKSDPASTSNTVSIDSPWSEKRWTRDEALSQEEWLLSLDYLAVEALLRDDPIGADLKERGWLPWRPNEAKLRLPARIPTFQEQKAQESQREGFAGGKNWKTPQDLFVLCCELGAFKFWDSIEQQFALQFVREDIASLSAAWAQTMRWGTPQALTRLHLKAQTGPQLGADKTVLKKAWGSVFVRTDSVLAARVLFGNEVDLESVKDSLRQLRQVWSSDWREDYWRSLPPPVQREWMTTVFSAIDRTQTWSREQVIVLTQMAVNIRDSSSEWLGKQMLRIEQKNAVDLAWMEKNGRNKIEKKMQLELDTILSSHPATRGTRLSQQSPQSIEWELTTRRFGDKKGIGRINLAGTTLWDLGFHTDNPVLMELSERLCGPMPLRIGSTPSEGSQGARASAAPTETSTLGPSLAPPSRAAELGLSNSVPNPYHLLALRDLARQKSGKHEIMGRGFDNARESIGKIMVFEPTRRDALLAVLELPKLPPSDQIPSDCDPARERLPARVQVDSPFTLEALLWRGQVSPRPCIVQWLVAKAKEDPQAAAARWAQAQEFALFPPVKAQFGNSAQREQEWLALSESMQLRGLQAQAKGENGASEASKPPKRRRAL